MKDLGLPLDPKLTFIHHINLAIGKAYGMLGFIIRCSKEFEDPYTLKQLYSTYVRLILEYASEVWCSYYGIHKKRIEFLKYALRNLGKNNRLCAAPICRSIATYEFFGTQTRGQFSYVQIIKRCY